MINFQKNGIDKVSTIEAILDQYDYSFRRLMTQKAIVDELLSYDEQLTRTDETCQLLLYHFKHKESRNFFDTINSLDQRLPQ